MALVLAKAVKRHFQQYFNYIVAVSFIGGGNRSKPTICRKSMTNFITQCCIEYASPWTGFQLTTLVVISTDCICSCKSNYHTMTNNVLYLRFNLEVFIWRQWRHVGYVPKSSITFSWFFFQLTIVCVFTVAQKAT